MDRQALLSNLFYRIFIVGVMAGLAWYAQKHSLTVADFNAAYARIPLAVVLIATIFDYYLDTGTLYRKLWGKRNGGPLLAIGTAGIFFITMVWLIAGSITLNLGTVSPHAVIAAGMLSLLALLPKTGTTEIGLLYYIATQIVTGFEYFTILPGVMF
ncbi:hypothetical protein PNA2_1308 [Pyrococcus sp. NA2]|uniref:hypothetical protein n=1 Tax=Pyrococcus sp. (strain NA2) TaxID=342949 RepID=UPI000209AD6C|nr:hypothetical protein [Pyrococcus sp. NA2]AEC52223.1 hypothetical protein PNA2_1308 [Pyrococcus sp. NA2]